MAAAAGVPPGGVGGGGGGGRQHLSAAPAEVARFFADVRTALERHPSLCGAGGVGAAFLFRIREPPLAWRVDLRSAPGGVRQLPDGGAGQDCDCVIEYRAAGDLAAINAGRLDLRKALILQRLKISGNLKALQRFHESMVRARAARGGVSMLRCAPLASPPPASLARTPHRTLSRSATPPTRRRGARQKSRSATACARRRTRAAASAARRPLRRRGARRRRRRRRPGR